MEDRLKNLLALVVEDVIETGEPVGSQHMVETHDLSVSSATVRNWFVELEAGGYIAQPHTSSGRIPTEKGYQLYLEELMRLKPLPKRARTELEASLVVAGETNRKIKSLAKCTAEIAGNAVFLGLNEADTFYTGLSQLFAQPEFREWNRVVSLSEVLDRLDDVLHRLRRGSSFREPKALIGSVCPFGDVCGSVLLTLPDGSLMGLLGPMRMDFRQGFALLSTAKELLMNI